MGRRPCCSKEGLNRGAWSAQEDKILTAYINMHGEGKWRDLPERAGLKRCGKSCRLRWLNYLRPDIKRGNFSYDEEELIIKLHKLLGNRWSLIAGRLPGRTDNEIKNYWNTHLSKKANSPPQQSNNAQIPLKQSKEEKTAGEQSHEVIRTKAVRCTKVYIPIQQDHTMISTHHNSKPICSESPKPSILQDLDQSNHFVDFVMEDFVAGIHCDYDFVQVCADQNPFRIDEVLQEDCLQLNVVSELRALASLLDSEEEWEEKQGKDSLMGGPSCVS